MIDTAGNGVVIAVRVIPRAARSSIAGTRDGALLVRLQAPPVEGAANAELIAVMAAACGVPKRAVTILSGARGRLKRVSVAGIDVTTARQRLAVG